MVCACAIKLLLEPVDAFASDAGAGVVVFNRAAHKGAVCNDKAACVYVGLLGHVLAVEYVLLAQPCKKFVGAVAKHFGGDLHGVAGLLGSHVLAMRCGLVVRGRDVGARGAWRALFGLAVHGFGLPSGAGCSCFVWLFLPCGWVRLIGFAFARLMLFF